jgi:hypothetical protein
VSFYSREALVRLHQEQAIDAPKAPPSPLAAIPGDAPMDDATLCAWNGERFVAYKDWLASVKVEADPAPPDPLAVLAGATVVAATCGGTRIWLARDGERWFMFAGTRKASGRRRDFASPYLAHAIMTAEQWYGAADGWRADKRDDGKTAPAPDLPPQGATGGNDDVDLDGR